jgi:hypothetical protein
MVVSESKEEQRPSNSGASGWQQVAARAVGVPVNMQWALPTAARRARVSITKTLWCAQSHLTFRSGRIAQLVERWSNKPLVLGSSPNVTTLFLFLGR